MNDVLRHWNELSGEDAAEEILPCNGARAWATRMAKLRPFASETALLVTADEAWRALAPEQWKEAFESHPRLGERHARAATEQSLLWSAGEQSLLKEEGSAHAHLLAANQAYELRFARVFLLCATGKSTDQVLAAVHRRLQNDPETELQEAAEQQRRITQLRLRRWLQLPAVRCEDV